MKKLLVILTAVVVILGIAYFLLPNRLHVKRTIEIEAPISVVFEEINTLKNWEKWSPWKQLDPQIQITYNDIPRGEGASYSWKSDEPRVDQGRIVIKTSKINQLITTNIFFRNNNKPSTSNFEFQEINGKTNVTWTIDDKLSKNPINKLIGMIINNELKTMFDLGLNGIKKASLSKKNS